MVRKINNIDRAVILLTEKVRIMYVTPKAIVFESSYCEMRLKVFPFCLKNTG